MRESPLLLSTKPSLSSATSGVLSPHWIVSDKFFPFSARAEDVSLCDHWGKAQAFPSESTDGNTSAWHVVVSSKTNDLREACFACVSSKSVQHIFGMFFFMQFPCSPLSFAVEQAI